ncbi:RES family NAD+ phosphorylase [Elizabethkingia sp. HX QKY]|uniref:RES family NAD+ phosphorylase n=1 Tax=Elizabethkingia TaxID=308865 RepID=UPI002A23EBC9|nr:RES family NAD+ phosphorylase [Elizabethkingia sp. HX QKY]MDX8572912.1 RES family NAD+ phosphorylase [Elizabethkingia sp. HX QKY]
MHKNNSITQIKNINNVISKLAYLLCSDCFQNEGLKITATLIGDTNKKKCENCNSTKGHMLNQNQLKKLVNIFFVRGSFLTCDFGGSPSIQFNEDHYQKGSVTWKKWIRDDAKLIENTCKIGFFYYAPRDWMLGQIEPLISLRKQGIESSNIIENIIKKYPTKILDQSYKFYRVRLSPQSPDNIMQYDSPPKKHLGSNRFDSINFPIFYGSPDLQLCIHECRATVSDKIYCATIIPTQQLKMLDLTQIIKESEKITESESLEMAVHFLFLASENSYNICRKISKKIKKLGFDGIIFPSYFSYVRTGSIPLETIYGISLRKLKDFKQYSKKQIAPNIAIFGRPIKEKRLKVECINYIQISKIEYNLNFGTV